MANPASALFKHRFYGVDRNPYTTSGARHAWSCGYAGLPDDNGYPAAYADGIAAQELDERDLLDCEVARLYARECEADGRLIPDKEWTIVLKAAAALDELEALYTP